MRLLSILLITVLFWFGCILVAKTLIETGEKKMKEILYFKLKDRIQRKYTFFLLPFILLAIYAPVVSVIIEAWIRGIKPLMNPAALATIITLIVVIAGLAYTVFYQKKIKPKKLEELSQFLRKWLSK